MSHYIKNKFSSMRKHALIKAVVAQGHKGVTVTRLWVRSPLEDMKYLFKFIFALVSRQKVALSFATQCAIPPKFGGKWGTEFLAFLLAMPSAYYS